MKLEPIWLGAPLEEELPSEFTVSTWNVWFDRFRREERNTALLAELEGYRPHVMIFQEVTPPFVRVLQATEWLRDGYWLSGVEHNEIGVVMVARLSKSRGGCAILCARRHCSRRDALLFFRGRIDASEARGSLRKEN